VKLAAVLVLCVLAPGCAGFQYFPWFDSQRWPGPMEAVAHPLPPGDATRYPSGPEEVRILRHADPVHVRMADSAGSIPLSFRRKEVRVSAGSGVACSDGGRAEVLWGNGTSMILSGRSDGIVGSPSRGEPSFILRDIEQVRFEPTAEDLYQLMGGAMLRVRDGPVRVTRVRPDVIRVSNEAKHATQITFQDETIVLDPGHAVDLPVLSAGAGPAKSETKLLWMQGPGFPAAREESAELSADGRTLVARGTGDVRALGVQVRLDAGTEARFTGIPASGGGR
jgi:hypothetical protein